MLPHLEFYTSVPEKDVVILVFKGSFSELKCILTHDLCCRIIPLCVISLIILHILSNREKIPPKNPSYTPLICTLSC